MAGELAVLRLRPATSGRWAALILAAADDFDRFLLGALLEVHAASVEPGCACPGAMAAADALLSLCPSHPSAVYLEAVLVELLAQEGGKAVRMN
jgi:hypothetical protein